MYKANGQGGPTSVVSPQLFVVRNVKKPGEILHLQRLPCFAAANAMRYGVDAEGESREVISAPLPAGD